MSQFGCWLVNGCLCGPPSHPVCLSKMHVICRISHFQLINEMTSFETDPLLFERNSFCCLVSYFPVGSFLAHFSQQTNWHIVFPPALLTLGDACFFFYLPNGWNKWKLTGCILWVLTFLVLGFNCRLMRGILSAIFRWRFALSTTQPRNKKSHF